MCLASRARRQPGTLPGPLLWAEAGFPTVQRLLCATPACSAPLAGSAAQGQAKAAPAPRRGQLLPAEPQVLAQLIHPKRNWDEVWPLRSRCPGRAPWPPPLWGEGTPSPFGPAQAYLLTGPYAPSLWGL